MGILQSRRASINPVDNKSKPKSKFIPARYQVGFKIKYKPNPKPDSDADSDAIVLPTKTKVVFGGLTSHYWADHRWVFYTGTMVEGNKVVATDSRAEWASTNIDTILKYATHRITSRLDDGVGVESLEFFQAEDGIRDA